LIRFAIKRVLPDSIVQRAAYYHRVCVYARRDTVNFVLVAGPCQHRKNVNCNRELTVRRHICNKHSYSWRFCQVNMMKDSESRLNFTMIFKCILRAFSN
jgi:hypothetical protein